MTDKELKSCECGMAVTMEYWPECESVIDCTPYTIDCDKCEAFAEGYSEDEAIAAWNTREPNKEGEA